MSAPEQAQDARLFAVTVVLKSGATQVIDCDKFSVVRSGLGDLKRLEWTNAKPEIMYLDVDEIAAVFLVES